MRIEHFYDRYVRVFHQDMYSRGNRSCVDPVLKWYECKTYGVNIYYLEMFIREYNMENVLNMFIKCISYMYLYNIHKFYMKTV